MKKLLTKKVLHWAILRLLSTQKFNRAKSKVRDHGYFDKQHIFVKSFNTTPSSLSHSAFSDVRFVATSFSPIKISVLKSIRTKSYEHAVRVSGNKISNDTTNDNLNHPIDTVLFAFDNYELDQAALLIL